jgi:hydroxymethylbilane synthase
VKKIKIATRKSPLAIWQAKYVKEELIKAHVDIEIELVSMKTKEIQENDRPLFAY